MTLVSVPCAVCGGSAFDPVYSATIPESDPAAYFSSSRLRAGHLAIVRCRECGLWLTNPRDDDATLARVYAALEDEAYAAEDANRRRIAREHMSLVRAFRPASGRLLDVGCATGTFVCAAREAGWEAAGLDASAWAVAQARRLCPEAVFVSGPMEEAAFPAESFDVITLWDVLEHVRSPAETLQSVRRWLAPEGWLFLNLPNADSWIAKRMGRHWVLLLREHLWYFSPSTLERLLRENGFELIQTRPNFVRFSVANIAGRLSQYPGPLGSLSRSLAGAAPLKRLALRFPIGDMNVVARKTKSG
jgi:2-polyprenyl-3-methyl-5-hydroxy-6-metoxy-1,4-benzoquinol methylase